MNEILKSFPNPADYISHSIFLLHYFFFYKIILLIATNGSHSPINRFSTKLAKICCSWPSSLPALSLLINLSGVKGLLRVRFGKTETYLHCNTVSLLTSLTFPENFSIIFSASDARRRFWKLNRHRSLKLQIRYAPLF